MLARGKRKRVGRKDVAFLRGIVPPGAAKPWAKQSLTPYCCLPHELFSDSKSLSC